MNRSVCPGEWVRILITIIIAHGSKLKLHTLLFDLRLSKTAYDGSLNMHCLKNIMLTDKKVLVDNTLCYI